MTQAFDIVIVGAGMVGAALATGLGREGFSVAMVDRAPAPKFDSGSAPDIRVSALSAGSERYLQSLGAWDHILNMRATPYRRLAVWDETRHPLSNLLPRTSNQVEFDAAELNTSHLGHIIENSVTQQGLWHAAEAEPLVTILAGSGVTGINQTGEQARVALDNGEELTATLCRRRAIPGAGYGRHWRYKEPVRPTGHGYFRALSGTGARHHLARILPLWPQSLPAVIQRRLRLPRGKPRFAGMVRLARRNRPPWKPEQ